MSLGISDLFRWNGRVGRKSFVIVGVTAFRNRRRACLVRRCSVVLDPRHLLRASRRWEGPNRDQVGVESRRLVGL
jgi:hypothetical protein